MVDPRFLAYVPSEQAVHTEDPVVLENVPNGHRMHFETVVRFLTKYFPMLHCSHVALFHAKHFGLYP
jgi:hypothetical protein